MQEYAGLVLPHKQVEQMVRSEHTVIAKHRRHKTQILSMLSMNNHHGMGETVPLSTTATAQMPAEEAACRVLKVVRDRQALPFLEIAALTGVPISVLTVVVKELASKEIVKLYGPDDPSNRVVAISGSYR
jgi:hypothetical protein